MQRSIFAALAAIIFPLSAEAGCGTGSCEVGVFGQGGESSGGSAQGGRIERPSTRYPGETYTNTGNEFAGRISVSDTGTIQGMARDDDARGHTSGAFGTASGHY